VSGPALPDRAALEAVATRAGAEALAHFRAVAPERKADASLVTAADRAVEALLDRELAARWPEVGLLGEEGAQRAGQGALRFVVDPIDGTSAFVAGLPTWCVSIGLLDGARPAAGVVHLPVAGELYTAAGGQAWWNGRPLPRLDAARAGGDPFLVADSSVHLELHVGWPGKIRSLGSAAYHAALVARGAATAALLGRVRIWDVAAAAALLDAVGGGLAWLADGSPVDLDALAAAGRPDDLVVAGTPDAVAALRAVVRPR
jgi:fructose-1,6-bisphosphatase/inositol monophosphatase family enzyme